jgi:putative hydrolase of the HAD superfamily
VPTRGLLCDAAGTLFAPARPVAATYAEVVAEFGPRIAPARIDAAFAEVFENAPPMAFPAARASEIPGLERDWWRNVVRQVLVRAAPQKMPRDFEACFDSLFAHFSLPASWRLLPGAAAALAAVRAQGVRVGIASNFDLRIHDILTGLGIADAFEAVVLPGEVRTTKPDPRFFRHALVRLGVTAGETLFLGDDLERDLAGARAVGITAIHAPSLATLGELPERVAEIDATRRERTAK